MCRGRASSASLPISVEADTLTNVAGRGQSLGWNWVGHAGHAAEAKHIFGIELIATDVP